MKFKKCKRIPTEISGPWRLACVKEVQTHMEEIMIEDILESWDIARLLDGWVSGPGYRNELQQNFRFGMGDMLLIETEASRPPDNSFAEELYSGIDLTPKGIETAVLLSCDDKNTEVIYWVLQSIEKNQVVLDSLTESVKETFGNGRTVLHYAADQSYSEDLALGVSRILIQNFDYGKELVKAGDKYGRTALHFAAIHGHLKLCKFLICDCKLKAGEKDRNGENPLHLAVNRNNKEFVNDLCELDEVRSTIYSHDTKGKTALHKAAAKGNAKIMETLLQLANIESRDENIRQRDAVSENNMEMAVKEAWKTAREKVKKFVAQADMFGQTALQEAVSRGHMEAVDFVLKNGSRPLEERNADGKTALHLAVHLPDENQAIEVVKLLLKKYKIEEEKSLLLWASATGVGTAEMSASSPKLKKFLQNQREAAAKTSLNLLLVAVKYGHFNMALDLITRGADDKQITETWIQLLNDEQKKNVETFRKHLAAIPERGRDQPTIEDSLGRSVFAEGLAELFLNPYVKTPVTVGISGDWGMGKSSLMIQTEINLLMAAAQLAFPNLLQIEKFPGSKELKLSKNGKKRYHKINKAVKHLVERSAHDHPLVHFLGKYQHKHRDVYRSLAAMDRSEMVVQIQVDNKTKVSNSEGYTLAKIPSILTVSYNAWHYQNELEAWAGLAVEITKVIEETMTTSQTMRTCCRYAWKENKGKIWLELFLPCLIAVFLAGWIAWAVWLLLNKSKHKEVADLKYGSIPLTVLVTVWIVVKQLLSVVKPVSDQIMGYVHLPDHKGNLGYQQKVIDDIKFLKEEMVNNSTPLWKFFAGEWCGNWFGLYPNTVQGTGVPKSAPASKDDLRIIVFVDDLDRCNDAVILQVLSAVNLVLAACEINVILGVDNKMIARAISKTFQVNNEKINKNPLDLAEKYISKIVQLPLALPDPSDAETQSFLRQQLGARLEDSNLNIPEEEVDTMWNHGDEFIDDIEEAYGTETDEESLAGEPTVATTEVTMESQALEEVTNHVVDVERNSTGASPRFLSPFSLLLKTFGSLRNKACLSTFLSGPETEIGEECKLRSTLLNSLMMMQNYSEEEREALTHLGMLATDAQKLPREWKRFLTYHRLVWNILSKIKEVKKSSGWQVQLLVWVFYCWQWKRQLNTIIKNWNKLVGMEDKSMNDEGPSLGNIVEHYIEGIFLPFTKDRPSNLRTKQTLECWRKLKDTLIKYDVSMNCIKYFEKYRLHCRVGHLPWPLPKRE